MVEQFSDARCLRLSVVFYRMSDQIGEGGRGQCWADMYGLSRALHGLVIDDIKHSWAATARGLIIGKRIMYLCVSKERGKERKGTRYHVHVHVYWGEEEKCEGKREM